jgi:hypothetical protein
MGAAIFQNSETLNVTGVAFSENSVAGGTDGALCAI